MVVPVLLTLDLDGPERNRPHFNESMCTEDWVKEAPDTTWTVNFKPASPQEIFNAVRRDVQRAADRSQMDVPCAVVHIGSQIARFSVRFMRLVLRQSW